MMQQPALTVRPARSSDASAMAQLVNMAGEGLPLHMWNRMARQGETGWDVGIARAARDEGAFSWRNSLISQADGETAALLVTYRIGQEPEPISPDMPAIVVPLQELENNALDTQYVNVLATFPQFRRQGHGNRLLNEAAVMAEGRRQSIIVSDGNETAGRLYERFGYRKVASRPIVKAEGWDCPGTDWVLMIRD